MTELSLSLNELLPKSSPVQCPLRRSLNCSPSPKVPDKDVLATGPHKIPRRDCATVLERFRYLGIIGK